MRKIASLGMVVAVLVAGCNPAAPPNVSGVVTNSLAILACGWDVYSADTSKAPPSGWAQIALDLATQCGMDAAAIVNAFGTAHPVSLAAQADAPALSAAVAARKK
jgi:hypothetical protein